MLNLKKFYSDELLQLALLLSLLRVNPDSYLGLDIQTIGVGSLDLNNGSGWHTDAHTIVHRPAYVHPKNLDSILLNYERDLFEDLNALGRYNRINAAHNDIHAYLLNVDEKAGPSAGATTDDSNARNTSSPDPPQASQTADESLGSAELTQEDMDLIEVLWKQDVDLGFTLVEPAPPVKSTAASSEDDIEKLKALEAINSSDDKKEVSVKEEPQKEDDPWAGLPYTVDLETGEYILCTNSGGSGCSSASSEPEQRVDDEEQQLLAAEASLSELVALGGEDSLGLEDDLGLENDFTAGLLGDDCLLGNCPPVDNLLGNDTLGLPDGFNLEEALQLVGLDEDQLEKKLDVKKKSGSNEDSSSSENSDGKESRASTSKKDEVGKRKSSDSSTMLHQHPTQYHHAHHPHSHRFHQMTTIPNQAEAYPHHIAYQEYRHDNYESLQARMSPFMRSEMTPLFMPGGSDHYTHTSHTPHHYYHPNFSYHSHHETAAAMAAQRNVILNNATLPPPVGDNCTGTYHSNAGGSANLGIAVATSMHLTNSSEPMGAGAAPDYKLEPGDMNYYTNTSVDPMNQTTEQLFQSVIDEPLLWADEMNFSVNDNLYGNSTAAANNQTVMPSIQEAAGANGPAVVLGANGTMGQTPAGATSLGTATDERMDASSDSAVSSMGSERVPSLSDGEWMETGSNSSHTQADSHYSMDYTGKYRVPYECGYPLPSGRASGQRSCHQTPADRVALAPIAQKKHQMFGKRCFQEQGPLSVPSAAAVTAHHPSVTPLKYDYEAGHQSVAARPPGQAYNGPIEGAAGPQSELKYSYSGDFSRQSGRSSLEHVQHNHTYHLPPESSGTLQRPISRDKKARKSDNEEHLTRDEKRARNLNVPISVHDIINLPMDEFNERLSKYDLSENQLSLIRDIRRRGKNKVAAQNCRKRKLDQINCLSDEVKQMRDRKIRLINESRYMKQERERVKEKFSQLYHHIFSSLRDPNGQPYDSRSYSLQETADGGVMIVPRSSQANGQYSHSRLDLSRSNGKPDNQAHHQQSHHPHHHHHHQEHKD